MTRAVPRVMRISEKLYKTDMLHQYFRGAREIDKFKVLEIMTKSQQCRMIMTYFPHDLTGCVADIIEHLLVIANTDRAFRKNGDRND